MSKNVNEKIRELSPAFRSSVEGDVLPLAHLHVGAQRPERADVGEGSVCFGVVGFETG